LLLLLVLFRVSYLWGKDIIQAFTIPHHHHHPAIDRRRKEGFPPPPSPQSVRFLEREREDGCGEVRVNGGKQVT